MINSKQILNRAIRECLWGESPTPLTLHFQENMGEPIYTITITKQESTFFIDEKGRKWVVQEEVQDGE